MGFSIETGVPAMTVFLQGLLSFFSPCVLPLIPLYMGYLSGGAKSVDENGIVTYKRSKVMLNTLFFVLGISFTFFLLGFGVSAAGQFFKGNQTLFARIGGILIVVFGLFQIGIFNKPGAMEKEHRLPYTLKKLSMTPITAAIFGFTFSFAWTPCVGPALASVLLMVASANTSGTGIFLIFVYTLGFVIPFLALGLFTSTVLDFFKKHNSVVRYTVKVGGILMVFMGIMMFTGWMNNVTGYLSSLTPGPNNQVTQAASEEQTEQEETKAAQPAETKAKETESAASEETGQEAKKTPAPDFTLTDQYGEEHTLSDYKGKTVFLNFWATWCPPCRAEMPDIQKIYEDYGENKNDLVVLGMAAPGLGQEGDEESVKAFLEENGYTYPVAMDTSGDQFSAYGITSFPTTFMIDKDGNIFGYATGQLTKSVMESIVKQTLEGKRTE